jgi:succinate dehydrogenase/fumarate reductase flavoprotein subunit
MPPETTADNGVTKKVEGEEQLKKAMDEAFSKLTPEERAKAEAALAALQKGETKLTIKEKLAVLKAYIPSDRQLGKGLAVAINVTEDLLVHGASRLRSFMKNVADGYTEGRK